MSYSVNLSKYISFRSYPEVDICDELWPGEADGLILCDKERPSPYKNVILAV